MEKKDNVIFGIHSHTVHILGGDLYTAEVHLGWKDLWEETKDVEDSQIYVEDECGYCESELEKEVPLWDIRIPGNIFDFITLRYDITSDYPIDIQEVIDAMKEAGFEYRKDFEEAIIKYLSEFEEGGIEL